MVRAGGTWIARGRALLLCCALLGACSRDEGRAAPRAVGATQPPELQPAASPDAGPPAPPPKAAREDTRAYVPAKRLSPRAGDLEEIRARKELRVLIRGEGEDFLPRAGMPASQDI